MRRFLPFLAIFFLTACVQPPQEITLLDGSPSSLDNLVGGKPAIVNFWASWCAPCKVELPLFDAVHRAHPEIAMVGVNLQESPKRARAYWKSGGYTFPSLLDPEAELKYRFDLFTQPTTIFLDAAGNIVSRKDGPLNEEELEKRVGELLSVAEEVVEIKEAKEPITVSPVPRFLSDWYEGKVQHLIPFEDLLSGGPGKDGIPAIDNPQFVSIADATFLEDDSVGILLEVAGDTRFYPFAILNWHEIVNDTVGGRAVAVTYCPLCATGVVFDRGSTTFGVSGFLYQSDLVMYDRATDSLWNQAKGQAIVGPLTGEKLPWVRSDVMRWKTVQDAYPDAEVMSTKTGYSRNYGRYPYAGYATSEEIRFPVQATDDRLHPKEIVYAIVVNGVAKAYPLDLIREQRTIEDTIGGTFVTVTWDRERVTFMNTETSEEIIPLPSFWFAWVAQYPDTELYQ